MLVDEVTEQPDKEIAELTSPAFKASITWGRATPFKIFNSGGVKQLM